MKVILDPTAAVVCVCVALLCAAQSADALSLLLRTEVPKVVVPIGLAKTGLVPSGVVRISVNPTCAVPICPSVGFDNMLSSTQYV